jgi:hypothetical protein
MNVASYQAVADGLRAWGEGERRTKDENLRKQMLKRQIEQDKLAEDERQFDRTMKTKQIEIAERGDKRAGEKQTADLAMTAAEAIRREREVATREAATAAEVKLREAQATAVAAKPSSPVAAQLEGVEDFSNNFAAALQENQAAMAEAAQLGTTTPRVLKAQIRLSALQQLSESWKKNAAKEPTVDLSFPGEDGVSKMTMKVPQSQWNQSHPMWGRFMSGDNAAPSAAPGGEQIPILTPEQAKAAKPGTKFRTSDGRILVR